MAEHPGTGTRKSPRHHTRVLLGNVGSSEPFEDIGLDLAPGLSLSCWARSKMWNNDETEQAPSALGGLTLHLSSMQLIKPLDHGAKRLPGRKLIA
jgi:hypothetical protein